MNQLPDHWSSSRCLLWALRPTHTNKRKHIDPFYTSARPPAPPHPPARPGPAARYAIISHVVHLVNRDYLAMCYDYYT